MNSGIDWILRNFGWLLASVVAGVGLALYAVATEPEGDLWGAIFVAPALVGAGVWLAYPHKQMWPVLLVLPLSSLFGAAACVATVFGWCAYTGQSCLS